MWTEVIEPEEEVSDSGMTDYSAEFSLDEWLAGWLAASVADIAGPKLGV